MAQVFYVEFGNWVKARRLTAGHTQDEVAALAGISRSTVSKIESAHVEVLGHNMLKICLVLGLPLSKLAAMVTVPRIK